MTDDEETGAEHDTYDSNNPDRDRETAEGTRRSDGKTAGTRRPPGEEQRDAPPRHPRA